MTPRDKIVARDNPQNEHFPPILQLILYLSLSFNLSRFSPALLNGFGAHTQGVRILGQGCRVMDPWQGGTTAQFWVVPSPENVSCSRLLTDLMFWPCLMGVKWTTAETSGLGLEPVGWHCSAAQPGLKHSCDAVKVIMVNGCGWKKKSVVMGQWIGKGWVNSPCVFNYTFLSIFCTNFYSKKEMLVSGKVVELHSWRTVWKERRCSCLASQKRFLQLFPETNLRKYCTTN